ncbi:MAG: hypothetical protein JNN15_00100 [Blastocatellia bacterium]|nr:hypothetical protein [Blastocatellia bacterium]
MGWLKLVIEGLSCLFLESGVTGQSMVGWIEVKNHDRWIEVVDLNCVTENQFFAETGEIFYFDISGSLSPGNIPDDSRDYILHLDHLFENHYGTLMQKDTSKLVNRIYLPQVYNRNFSIYEASKILANVESYSQFEIKPYVYKKDVLVSNSFGVNFEDCSGKLLSSLKDGIYEFDPNKNYLVTVRNVCPCSEWNGVDMLYGEDFKDGLLVVNPPQEPIIVVPATSTIKDTPIAYCAPPVVLQST